VTSAWDGIIANLEKEVADNKAAALEAGNELRELEKNHEERTGSLRRFIDGTVDQVHALQSMLDHARRERDGDPLNAVLMASTDEAPEVRDQ
jgi:hypothetical protein